ncbi:type IV conjugative transfer system lipoprotein TraV [Xenorhabdus sp. TH1]|uniref:type IV conjugative transfer system lipoprotein TraV n=1 Tax=Xenorhabdus sp. TH1 TaxID=3130166 RepID=UPI0030CB3C53
MKKLILAPLMGMVALSLGACSSLVGNSEFGCKGMPNSVTCMSVRDVHKLTDGDDYQEKIDLVSKKQQNGESVTKDEIQLLTKGKRNQRMVAESGQYTPVPKPAANPQPIRSESMVMRILIDPYENTEGDLVVAGYIYTEIAPRTWDVGEPRHSNKANAVLTPLQSPEPRPAPPTNR